MNAHVGNFVFVIRVRVETGTADFTIRNIRGNGDPQVRDPVASVPYASFRRCVRRHRSPVQNLPENLVAAFHEPDGQNTT